MIKRILSRLRRFRRDEDGTILMESVIMLPTLFVSILASYAIFDSFRNQSINLKAAYTISDAISRESDVIDNTYINNLWRMHRFLTNARALTQLRITIIQYDEHQDEYSVVWSEEKGGAGTMSGAELTAMVEGDEVPVMPHEEVLIVVQTWVDHEPIFSIGLDAFTFENTIFTRPRFSPRMVCYAQSSNSPRVCPIGS